MRITMCHVAMFSYTNIVWRQKTIKTSKLFTDLWIWREKGKHKNIQKLFHHKPPGPKTQRSDTSEEWKNWRMDSNCIIAPLTPSPTIMKVEKMLYLKGNYFWRHPFLTSMIMGNENKYTPPKTNMEPKNNGLEDDFPFPGVYSQVLC